MSKGNGEGKPPATDPRRSASRAREMGLPRPRPGPCGPEAASTDTFRTTLSPMEQHLVLATVAFRLCSDFVAREAFRDAAHRYPWTDMAPVLSGRACPSSPRLDLLHGFTEEVIDTRGRPSGASLKSLLDAGFTRSNILEVIQAVTLRAVASTGSEAPGDAEP